ncbi:MAG: hypothetical protein E5X80_32100 [Mesorhizobium sp.]|uniref:hypothetical protein n=1 Tax=Mesorhizobium sp. TaxID=1871066 RepID=UPI000FE63C9E|nr:hypothetical protein [Mesorhizobium sp.]RWM04655.1 MAG: hypothetical protein EOR71_25910 [Mesorhizobium sp.]TIO47330.1 MAG: hypothetical protein E5X78_32990 [Mesorhizobium sp.]TIO57155.1 MAG: hypothetical protein E5X79_27545 [Mesorhizobium sp.]TJV56494.1 MAG: hypothetical protein E5X80_32100 [Mesorhizobium sp.]
MADTVRTKIAIPAKAVAALLVAAAPHAAFPAQPVDGKPPLDSNKPGAAIVDSDIRQEEALSKTEAGKVITAIDRTRDNIGTVRKTTKLDTVDIVFLTDAARSEGGPPPVIEDKVEQHKDDVAELRQEIEANALLFNAIDSRRLLAEDVLAVEFDNPGKIVIYAAAKPPK